MCSCRRPGSCSIVCSFVQLVFLCCVYRLFFRFQSRSSSCIFVSSLFLSCIFFFSCLDMSPVSSSCWSHTCGQVLAFCCLITSRVEYDTMIFGEYQIVDFALLLSCLNLVLYFSFQDDCLLEKLLG